MVIVETVGLNKSANKKNITLQKSEKNYANQWKIDLLFPSFLRCDNIPFKKEKILKLGNIPAE